MRGRKEGDDAAEGEAGFVLVSVLLVIVIFVGFAASLAVKSRLLAMQGANRAAAIHAQGIADGAALFAADALRPAGQSPPDPESVKAAALGAPAALPAPASLPLPVDGTPLACPLGANAVVVVRATDQGGLVDLNGAPVAMLNDFFAAAGLDAPAARRLADEVADFRDPDDDPQENGIGERAQYDAASLPWGPRNGPFADAGEVAQLPSATALALARLRPLLTVGNPRAGIDLAAMPAAARAALPADAATRPALRRWQTASARDGFEVEARFVGRTGTVLAARGALVDFAGAVPGELRVRRWWRPPADVRPGAADEAAEPFCRQLRAALGRADD